MALLQGLQYGLSSPYNQMQHQPAEYMALTRHLATNTATHAANIPQTMTAIQQTIKPKEVSMFQSFKNFVNENKNVIYTVAGIVLIDHFVFGGAFRNRLKSIINNLLDRAEKTIDSQVK